MSVSFDIDRSGGATIVQMHGEVDLDAADEVLEKLRGAVLEESDEPVERVIVDLYDVSMLDSTGVGALVAAYNLATAQGVKLVVINARGIVQRVLRIAGVLEILTSTTPHRGRPRRRS
ncbi:MAG TPA: STAS domain-containing protein [Micromonosporaceae bacterium]|nr:STAS domain-containing protein [Micromonosporaceae bacterium]